MEPIVPGTQNADGTRSWSNVRILSRKALNLKRCVSQDSYNWGEVGSLKVNAAELYFSVDGGSSVARSTASFTMKVHRNQHTSNNYLSMNKLRLKISKQGDNTNAASSCLKDLADVHGVFEPVASKTKGDVAEYVIKIHAAQGDVHTAE